MSNGINFNDYHHQVKQWLAEALPEITLMDDYPSTETVMTTPCAVFAVTSWKRAAHQSLMGTTELTLAGEVHVFVSTSQTQHALRVCQAAMAIALEIDESRFGLSIEPALLIKAEPVAATAEHSSRVTWAVRFEQTLSLGESVSLPPSLVPTQVWVGYDPEIGSPNQDRYQTVVTDD
ncbi:hypothetical protein ACFFUP_18090 [Vibrio ostreicida]|nr:hypothetical protein [Vibrio ostreicida]NPD09282.1 hypothetical protein [Vibrio ostreicida]